MRLIWGQLCFVSVYSIKQRQFAVKHNILSGHINTMVGVWIWQFWFGGFWFVFSNSLSCHKFTLIKCKFSFNEFIFYKIHLNAYGYARAENEWSLCELSPKVAIFSVIKLLLMSLVHVYGGFFLVGDQTVEFKSHIKLFKGKTLQDIKIHPFRENFTKIRQITPIDVPLK